MSSTNWQPPGMQPLPSSAAGDMRPDGSFTNRSYRNDADDLNYMAPTSARSGAAVSGNPFAADPHEEVVFSSLTQQQAPPRERPRSAATPRQQQQQPLPSSLGGRAVPVGAGGLSGDLDEEGEKYERIAVPLSIASMTVGFPLCSIPSLICAWGCCCCAPQEKKRRSIWAIVFASVAIVCGLAIIIGACAGWSNREVLMEIYENMTMKATTPSKSNATTPRGLTALPLTTLRPNGNGTRLAINSSNSSNTTSTTARPSTTTLRVTPRPVG